MSSGPERRPTPAELVAARDRTIPDVAREGLRVLFAGINPGLYSAATGYHFARPGNRFWPTLFRSGFTPGSWPRMSKTICWTSGSASPTWRPVPLPAPTNSIPVSSARAAGSSPPRWPRSARAGSPWSASPRSASHSTSGARWWERSPMRSAAPGSGAAQPQRPQRPLEHCHPGRGVRPPSSSRRAQLITCHGPGADSSPGLGGGRVPGRASRSPPFP